jgi:hypothetical protein
MAKRIAWLSTLAAIDEPDIELVFVDDGWTDGTADYLRPWQSRIHSFATLHSRAQRFH